MLYEDKHKKPNFLVRFILKLLVKPLVTGGKSYKKNTSTAPAFLIADKKQFEAEKTRLIAYIQRTQQLGAEHFEGLASHSFGNLTSNEWNNLFYKHLDHHFTQFGV
jgi:SRSO17 transposase